MTTTKTTDPRQATDRLLCYGCEKQIEPRSWYFKGAAGEPFLCPTCAATKGIATEYEIQAITFLAAYGFILTIERGGASKFAPWCDRGEKLHNIKRTNEQRPCGQHYDVTIQRTSQAGSMSFPPHNRRSFDFWGSIVDFEADVPPTPYDILACLSSEVSGETDPDAVYHEYGDVPPSRAIAIAESARAWQGFFTVAEREALAEIQ